MSLGLKQRKSMGDNTTNNNSTGDNSQTVATPVATDTTANSAAASNAQPVAAADSSVPSWLKKAQEVGQTYESNEPAKTEAASDDWLTKANAAEANPVSSVV